MGNIVVRRSNVDRVLDNRYQLQRQVAHGGMATVWEAHDNLLSRRVAVKTLHPHLAADDSFKERFHAEAVAAARLSHPNIVATYDTGEDDGMAYIVMEFVDGKTLREILDERPQLAVPDALRIGSAIAMALAHAHDQGLVHRDIKPANVLIARDGLVKVTDFGIAKASEDKDLTRTGTIMGTAKYLAPEQVQGLPLDGRADVYALGVVLYESLTGQAPFVAENDMATAILHVNGELVPPSQLRPDLPPDVEALVLQCLARDPDDRFRSARAVARAMQAARLTGNSAAATAPASSAGSGGAPSAARTDQPRPASRPAAPPVEPGNSTRVAQRPMPSQRPGAEAPGRRSSARQPTKKRSGVTAGTVFLLIMLLVVGGAAVYLIGQLGSQDSTVEVPIANALPFDPNGDGDENGGMLLQLRDGDTQTMWQSEGYGADNLADRKGGTGFILTVAEPVELASLTLVTPANFGSYSASIYVSDAPQNTVEAWGQPVAARENPGTNAKFGLDGTTGAAVLVWLTDLPDVEDTGGRFRIKISEAELRADR